MVIAIKEARYLGGYKISFLFSDGKERTVDFESFLKKAKNPMSKKYMDKKAFKKFQLQHGDILWNDYEMCFPVWDLYEGKI